MTGLYRYIKMTVTDSSDREVYRHQRKHTSKALGLTASP